MTIPRSTETRLCERLAWYFAQDADFFVLCQGEGTPSSPTKSARIYSESFLVREEISIQPRQMHIFPSDVRKAGAGGPAWDVNPEIAIEYFTPRKPERTTGAVTVHDEAKQILNLLFVGEVQRSPGRFYDPDAAGKTLTTMLEEATLDANVVKSGWLFIITARFLTRENATGERA